MEHNWQDAVNIPKAEHEELETFVGEVVEAVESELDAVIVYGSVAKGDYCEQTSDINVLLSFADITMDTLDALAPVLQRATRRFRLSSMLLTRKDLARSTDVFPIKFLDMKAHHVLLWGKDVLADVEVESAHLRLRCEQEFKNLAIRLRAFYLQRVQRAERIEQTLSQTFTSFLVALDTLLYLQTGEHTVTKEAIISKSQQVLDTDTSVLRDLQLLRKGEIDADLAALKSLYGALMALIQRAADRADALE